MKARLGVVSAAIAVLVCMNGAANAQRPSQVRPATGSAEQVSWQPATAGQQTGLMPEPEAAGGTSSTGPRMPDYWTPPSNENTTGMSSERYWARADYLMWWTRGSVLPPLVTASPPGTPQSQAGVLGQPGTVILFGNEEVGNQIRSGVRLKFGAWLGDVATCGIEADYFNLGQESAGFDNGARSFTPILSRPFFNMQTVQQAAELVSFPDVVSGRVTADYHDWFDSAGVWGRFNVCCNLDCDDCSPLLRRVDLIAGYRYYGLNDSVVVREDLVSGPGSQVPGTSFLIEDAFRARNEFHGGEIGLITQCARGPWSLEVLTKMAIGNNHQTVVIAGQTVENGAVSPVGILAGATNSGTFRRDEFTVIPQLGVDVGYEWNCHLRTFLGYNLLYWADVQRAGDQIDLRLDPRNFPPGTPGALPFPSFLGQASSFWAQGINFGLQLQY